MKRRYLCEDNIDVFLPPPPPTAPVKRRDLSEDNIDEAAEDQEHGRESGQEQGQQEQDQDQKTAPNRTSVS